jgi:hypothetical protein
MPELARKAFQPGPYRKGELIIRAGSQAELAQMLQRAQQAGGEMVDIIPGMLAARLRFGDSGSMAKFLEGGSGQSTPELNYTVALPTPPPPVDPSAPGSLTPFGSSALSFMGVPQNNGSWGKGVTVAMLDTGLSPGETNTLHGSTINELDLVGGASPAPGHGDMVAALLDGTTGQQGIAPGASLLSVRVLDSNNVGDVFTVAQGLATAVSQGAKVINLSLGTDQPSTLLQDAVTQAQASGAVIVAAVGNDGVGAISYPAAYDGVVAVGAVDATGQRATFSNYGPQMTISAPGVGISTQTPTGLMSFSGTSAAAPLVAGAIASLMSTDTQMTPQQAVGLLTQYANYEGPAPTGTTNTNQFYGAGVIALGRVLNRNDTSYADIAMADTFLNLDGVSATPADGATTTVQVLVQNRGNSAFASAQLNLDVNGQASTHILKGMAPGAVQAVTVTIPVSQLVSGGVIVNANVQGLGQPDANPTNNALSRLLQIKPPATTTTTTP